MKRQEFESMTLCPLDGRYSGIKDALGEYFSEYALVKYRVFVEIQWLKFLINNIDNDILAKFNQADMSQIEAIPRILIMIHLLVLKTLRQQHVMMSKLLNILLEMH